MPAAADDDAGTARTPRRKSRKLSRGWRTTAYAPCGKGGRLGPHRRTRTRAKNVVRILGGSALRRSSLPNLA